MAGVGGELSVSCDGVGHSGHPSPLTQDPEKACSPERHQHCGEDAGTPHGPCGSPRQELSRTPRPAWGPHGHLSGPGPLSQVPGSGSKRELASAGDHGTSSTVSTTAVALPRSDRDRRGPSLLFLCPEWSGEFSQSLGQSPPRSGSTASLRASHVLCIPLACASL